MYIEHFLLEKRFNIAVERLEDLLREREEIFDRTQPRSIPFDKDKVDGGGGENAMDAYLIELERKQIDERIADARYIVEQRKDLLQIQEEALRRSGKIEDIVYRLKYLEGKSVKNIAETTFWSERKVYRIAKQIQKDIEQAEASI